MKHITSPFDQMMHRLEQEKQCCDGCYMLVLSNPTKFRPLVSVKRLRLKRLGREPGQVKGFLCPLHASAIKCQRISMVAVIHMSV